MKKIIAQASYNRNKFLPILIEKILKIDDFSGKFFNFLENKNFDKTSQGFLNSIELAGYQLHYITTPEKLMIKEGLSLMSSVLWGHLRQHAKAKNCFTGICPDSKEVTIKKAIRAITVLMCHIHDKPSQTVQRYSEEPVISNEFANSLSQNKPEIFPSTISILGHNVLWKDKDTFFIGPVSTTVTSRHYIVFGVDAHLQPIVIKRIEQSNNTQRLWNHEKKILQKLSQLGVSSLLTPITFFEDTHNVFLVLPVMGFFYGQSPKFVWRDTYECFKETYPTPLKIALVKHYFSVFVDVIKKLHDESIFHLDLKPANALLDANGQLKITDFETAMQTPVATKHKKGTYGFMHPKIQECAHNVILDLWSLGATLFNLCLDKTLTGLDDPYGDDAFYFADKQVEQTFFAQVSIENEIEIKKTIYNLTTIPSINSKYDSVLTRISTYTNNWKQDDNTVRTMLYHFSKEMRVV